MHKLTALCLLTPILVLAACGSGDITLAQEPDLTTTTEPVPAPDDVVTPDLRDGPVLVVQESGGCSMVGPNCRTISFKVDGSVDISYGEAESVSESTLVDPALIARWLEVTASTDFDSLVDRLPEGECKGCSDGIDLVLGVQLEDRTVDLDSQAVRFVPTEPFFTATTSLMDAVPFTLGEPSLSSDPTTWNTPIDPALDIEGLPITISAELPVVVSPGRALGGGILDAGASTLGADDDYVYIGVGGARGCASFEHLALVPTGVGGVYELFHDTDNTCEAAGVTGYRTPIVDLTPDIDGVITIVNANGATTTIAID